MALALMPGEAGFTPDRIKSPSAVSIGRKGGGFQIAAIDLSATGKAPGIDGAKLREIATKATDGRPVSKVLNAEISFEAALA